MTQYDTKVDFNNYKTYSITNTITKISDNDTTYISGSEATTIISTIEKNMEARGFVKPAGTDKPDLGINLVYHYQARHIRLRRQIKKLSRIDFNTRRRVYNNNCRLRAAHRLYRRPHEVR